MKSFQASILLALLLSAQAQAALFNLPQLTSAQTDPIFAEFASLFAFRPMEPASAPQFMGFYVGITGTGATASQIVSLVGTSIYALPMAEIAAGISAPFGLGVDLGYLPPLSFNSVSLSQYAGSVRWSFTNIIPQIPFDMLIRATYASSTLALSGLLGSSTVTISYASAIYGGQFQASKKISAFEPYLGIGYLSQSSTLSSNGNAQLFASGFSAAVIAAQSLTSVTGSLWLQVGVQARFSFFMVGLEYNNIFGADSASSKIGFKF